MKRCECCPAPADKGRFARFCGSCRRQRMRKPCKYVWTPERDAYLRAHYDGRRWCGNKIAAALAWPKWVVTRRAQALGLCRPVENRRAWTLDEERFLETHAGTRLAAWIGRKLGRSTTSVIQKIKHSGLRAGIHEGHTMRDLELCFGVDHHAIERWLTAGKLTGKRRHDNGAARDAWEFHDEDIRAFVYGHPTAFDLRRVDQTWFLDLVTPRRRNGSVIVNAA